MTLKTTPPGSRAGGGALYLYTSTPKFFNFQFVLIVIYSFQFVLIVIYSCQFVLTVNSYS